MIHVGAYAASAGLDEAGEDALYEGIAALGAAGLEQPFDGALARDEGRLIARIRPTWSLVLTLLPGEMKRLAGDKDFGLASADASGRARALEFAEAGRLAVERLNRALGRRAVIAVQVHSAPRLGGSGAKSSTGKQSGTELWPMVPGVAATCCANWPSDMDFSWGFQASLSSGTRSSTRRVVFASLSSSRSSTWERVMRSL